MNETKPKSAPLVYGIKANNEGIPAGYIEVFVNDVPNGWLKCDGSKLSQETCKDLYENIGDKFNPSITRKLSLWESVKHFFKTGKWKREEVVINIPDMNGMFCVPDMRGYTFKEKEE